MKETQPELPDRRVNPLDAVFMLSIVLAVGVSFIWLPLNIGFTITLLLGGWGLSVDFKRIIGVGK